MGKSRCFLMIFYLLISSNSAMSQTSNDSLVSGIIQELISVWEIHNNDIRAEFSYHGKTDSTGIAPFSLKHADNSNRELNKLMIEQKNQQANLYRTQKGIELIGNYTRNVNAPFFDSEDNMVFKQRAQIGLDWSVLDNGWYENKIRAKQMEYEASALQETVVKSEKLNNLNQIKSCVYYAFNKQKTELLNRRRNLSKAHLPIAEKLHHLKQINNDSYLQVISNKSDINSQLEIYHSYNQLIESSFPTEIKNLDLPLVDIDLNILLQSTASVAPDSAWMYLCKKQTLEYDRWKDVNLHAQLKYNYFDLYNTNTNYRRFVSMGLTFGLPVQMNRKAKEELLETENQLIQHKEKNSNNELQYVILNICYEFRYKLKQYLNLLQKRNSFYENIRMERVKHKFNDIEFNPHTALLLLDDMYKIDIELIDLKQNMYRDLLSISEKLPEFDMQKALKPVTPEDSESSIKAVYIWSHALDSLGADYISEYCQLNGFNRLIVSAKPEATYLTNVNKLISKAKAEVELLIGQNTLLQNDKITSYLETIKQNCDLGKTKGIHIDVEPQATDEYKTEKENVLTTYKSLITEVHKFTQLHKLELSVSIPLHYSEDVLLHLDSLCDHIYLMAYENTSEDFILRKTEEERKLDSSKLVIAQRTKDFSNRLEVNQKLTTLTQALGITHTAIHDINGLIKMDRKMIQLDQSSQEKKNAK